MRNITIQITAQLTRDEGKRYVAYSDSRGISTIGIGHDLQDSISDTAVDQIFQDDLALAENELQTDLPWTSSLDDVRYGALVNLTFNLGIGGLEKFKLMLAALMRGNFNEAANQLLNSAYANEVGDRAQRLATQIITGVWQ